MSLYATAGLKLYIGEVIAQKSENFAEADFSSQTWVRIGQLENLGNLGDAAQGISIDLIDEARSKTLKGTRSAGNMEVVCGADMDDLGQSAVIAAEKRPFDFGFLLVMNDRPPEKSSTATITIASPGVVTWSGGNHGRRAGDKVKFSTTGALPSGIVAETAYYVLSTGLTSDSFRISETDGGSAVGTSGTQSGVHTVTTVPENSKRMFIAKVMSVNEVFDSANNVRKLNFALGVNSNIVRVAATVS
jgi:hypothetical protein